MHSSDKSIKIKTCSKDEPLMQVELTILEEKISSLITLYQKSCQDNHALQEELNILYQKNEALIQKTNEACERIEDMLARLPGGEHVGQ